MTLKPACQPAILLLVLFLGCGTDDEKRSYSFKDQDLTGEIGGNSWTYEDGFVKATLFNNKEILDVRLFLAQEVSACEVTFAAGDHAIFNVPGTVGLYQLSLNSSSEGRVVNLILGGDIPNNNFASKGAIEILTLTATGMTGRIDARLNDDYYINGNFVVSFCGE